MKNNSIVKILSNKGDLYFCEYECGLYTVDKSNKSIGMTLKASFDKAEVENYYNSL